MTASGIKFDSGKLQLRLLPWKALQEVGKVVTDGATKYSPDNWKYVRPFEERYIDAALRHFVAHLTGEIIDPDSGSTHLAHVVANILFLMEGPTECPDIISPATTVTQAKTEMSTGKSNVPAKTLGESWRARSVEPL